MKKVLFSLLLAMFLSIPAFAYDAASRVDAIGKDILVKNAIAITGVKFMVVSGAADNSSYATNKVINISTNDLAYAGNDNEVAAVVADTLGHIISGHAAQGQIYSLFTSEYKQDDTASKLLSNYNTSKQNKEADVIAVNLMSNGGYNPLALIVLLVKQPVSNMETLQGKPANGDRALNIYEYANYAYPAKVKAGYGCNEYKNFLTYATTTINARKAKDTKKVNKELDKYRKDSVSKISKFKVRGGVTGWDAAFNLLNNATTTESK